MALFMRAHATPTDADLVASIRSGKHDAFATIVSRYQALVCSVTYSGTGNLHASEELAHETFVTAWTRLGDLQEPERLRSWLCGIARNLVLNARRREQRSPVADSSAVEDAAETPLVAPVAQPADAAVSREEEAILWRSISAVPETYREPLILYYREGLSVAKVAELLGSSEEAVRQQLSRGRKLLQEQVVAFVEGALARTAPGDAFTAGVMGALPPLAVGIKLGALSTGAKVGSSLATFATLGAWIGGLSGGAVGWLGAYLGYRVGLDQARSEQERVLVRRLYRGTTLGVLAFLAVLFMIVFGWRFTGLSALMLAISLVCVCLVYAGVTVAVGVWHLRQIRVLRRAAITGAGPAGRPASRRSFRSRGAFLGLPWVHVEFGADSTARGWIAVSDYKAVGGLLAFGGVAIAPIAVGALALGVVGIGGLGVGLLAAGGIGIGLFASGGLGFGIWALAGCAFGRFAAGGFAMGWEAASGAFAISKQIAAGTKAIAPHANDAAAQAMLASHPLFSAGRVIAEYPGAASLLPMLPLILWMSVLLIFYRKTR